MNRWKCLCVSLIGLLPASALGLDWVFGNSFETIEAPGLEGTLAVHNAARREVGVPPLAWDVDLAASAQAWANQCVDVESPSGVVDTNPDRSIGFAWNVGENIVGFASAVSGTAAAFNWLQEEPNYDPGTGQCTGPCSRYTQMVWSTTLRIGCGISSCPGLAFGNTVVCDYGPAGNTGGPPY